MSISNLILLLAIDSQLLVQFVSSALRTNLISTLRVQKRISVYYLILKTHFVGVFRSQFDIGFAISVVFLIPLMTTLAHSEILCSCWQKTIHFTETTFENPSQTSGSWKHCCLSVKDCISYYNSNFILNCND